jgi:two-component system LytT family sensor kinase
MCIFVHTMRKKLSAYWLCQITGWALYGLSFFFLARIFDQEVSPMFLKRIMLWLILGVFCTDLFRKIIHNRKLLPPLAGKKWIELFLILTLVCFVYSLLTSVLVEVIQLYDERIKSFPKRLLSEFLTDGFIIVLWSSIYYIWHYIEASRKTELDRVHLESLVKELQLKTIKSHINPHFIFNALNSIRALVDENPGRARTAITELSNILRSSMQAEKLETAPLERELNLVKDYLELEHIRFEDRLRVEYDIDEDTLDQQVPPMMLQTLVENAIKHGISKQVEGGYVKIISDFKNNVHELVVQNTGHINGTINTDGFGIASTQNRLKLLYGNKAAFEIKNINGNMVEAKVTLPVQNN